MSRPGGAVKNQKDDKSKVPAVGTQKDDKTKAGTVPSVTQKDDKSKVPVVGTQKDDKAKVTAAETQKEVKAAASAKECEPTLSRSEIIQIIEKSVTEALSQRMSSVQSELSVQKQELGAGIQKLDAEFQDANTVSRKRVQDVDASLGSLHQRCAYLESFLKDQLDPIIVQKIRWIRQWEPEPGRTDAKWTEQMAIKDSAHQAELTKLHEQHHQDMLSVINDCCRKLKSGFTRQNKPYEVNEIHSIIDDTEQKMVQEILFEIQKTNTHEDLSGFSEAMATVKHGGGELGKVADEGGNTPKLTADDISAALNTFEDSTFETWAEELQPSGETVGEYVGPEQPVAEEKISKHEATFTGDRGNIYYAEELKKAVDDIIATDEKTASGPNIEELKPDLPLKSEQELEESLESLIIPGSGPGAKTGKADQKKPDAGTEKKPATSTMDANKLKSLEAGIEKEMGKPGTVPTFPTSGPSTGITKIQEGKTDPASGKKPETSTLDLDQLRSLEDSIESDMVFPDFSSTISNKDQDQKKPTEGTGPVPAKTSKDDDKLKSIEAMLEASMIQDVPDGNKTEEPLTTPTATSARQALKEGVSGNVTGSASSAEVMHTIPTIGPQENPFYVEEIISATSKAKDVPKTGNP